MNARRPTSFAATSVKMAEGLGMGTATTARRKRCSRCKILKPVNPKHPNMCADCVPLYQAWVNERHAEHQAQRVAAIKARMPSDHLSLLREPLERARNTDFKRDGVMDCSVSVDADALDYLIGQYELMRLRLLSLGYEP